MAVRAMQPGDAAAMTVIANANKLALAAVWPASGGLLPTETPASILRFANAPYQTRVWLDAGGVLRSYLTVVQTPSWEEAVAWFVDLTGTQAAIVARFRTSMKELITDWAQDLIARGIPRARGDFPNFGAAHPSVKFLADMTAANGLKPDTKSRPGWLRFHPTPQQLLTGINGLAP